MKRKTNYLIALTLIMFIASCGANFLRDSYRTMSVSAITYDTILKGAGDLYREGKITDEIKDEFIEVGDIYAEAHATAVDAIAAYSVSKSADDEVKAQVALLEFQKVMTRLLALASKYAIKF